MVYKINLLTLPVLKTAYEVVRKTVWDIADSQNILILVKSGSCRITMDGINYLLREGDAIIIPGGHHYRREPVGDVFCTLRYMHFILQEPIEEYSIEDARTELLKIQEDDIDNFLQNKDDLSTPDFSVYLSPVLSLGEDAKKAFEISDEIQSAQKKDSLSRNITASLHLCRLITRLSNISAKQILDNVGKVDVSFPRKLRRAVIYIQTHISEPISLDTLSGICHVSKQQLIRYFKNELNTTPIAYINNLKVSRAKEYLQRHPEIPINEVCAELGFDDPLYFSRLFSKIYGEAPSKFRQRVRNYKPPTEENT